ncbi:MAG: Catalase related subgroup protein [Phycisphaerales bacterium]|nr:Catalase related subgroup protein [Phycisphaerales bacterium]
MKRCIRVFAAGGTMAAALLLAPVSSGGQESGTDDLARQIFETMLKVPGTRAGHRPVHAKGIVCQGTFEASAAAGALSRAAHFRPGPPVPVTVRFSDGAPDPAVADTAPDAGPRGLAIRFDLPGGDATDIVAMSHNGFVVGTGEEFLALQQAIVATDPAQPHPWPVERFLAARPRAMKFVQDNRAVPASFATEAFFGNDAFVFVNKDGARRAGRYRLVPVAGTRHLDAAETKSRSPDFLSDELKARLATEPVRFRLVAQLPDPGDPTKDPSLVWRDDRKTVDLGTISLTSVAADPATAERRLAFDPTNLTDGIELSDDPLPALRSAVYALSVKHRRAK